jgi:hypothetical protein
MIFIVETYIWKVPVKSVVENTENIFWADEQISHICFVFNEAETLKATCF